MAGPAHRSVSIIKPSITGGQPSNIGAPGSPHTPLRTISSNFASPSTLRAEEDYVIIELGNRYMRVGFGGDSSPKAVIPFGLEQQRRAGDYRKWQANYDVDWRSWSKGKHWGDNCALWNLDLKAVDLGLVSDKIERALRDAFSKHLLVDSRPRKMVLVIPAALPRPLLSAILDTIFNNYQPPTISLLSAPVLTTVGAGLRSALIVDIGWAETVVTGIYEYREVVCRRTVRASKLLCWETLKLLGTAVTSMRHSRQDIEEQNEKAYEEILSFEECEEVMCRMIWCRPRKTKLSVQNDLNTFPSVDEGGIMDASIRELNPRDSSSRLISIPLSSTQPPTTISLSFFKLSHPCEIALFADGIRTTDLDDEETPIDFLIYQTLLHLPVDIRSVCMSRIIFTGGGSSLPGLKNRILSELNGLIRERHWNPVQGQAVEQIRQNRTLLSTRSKQENTGLTETLGSGKAVSQSRPKAGLQNQEPDPIEDKIKHEANKVAPTTVKGVLRAVESMGAWAGASLLSQLKISAVAIVEREQWLQSGTASASRQGEVPSVSQRLSMGPGALKSGTGDRTSWTLGLWG